VWKQCAGDTECPYESWKKLACALKAQHPQKHMPCLLLKHPGEMRTSARIEGSVLSAAKRATRAIARRRMLGAMRANSSSITGLRMSKGTCHRCHSVAPLLRVSRQCN